VQNVFDHISLNSRPFWMKQKLICMGIYVEVWYSHPYIVKPVITGSHRSFCGLTTFFKFKKLQPRLKKTGPYTQHGSGLLQSSSVQFRSFFRSYGLDLETLMVINTRGSTNTCECTHVRNNRPQARDISRNCGHDMKSER
jgi:hypothetical protein